MKETLQSKVYDLVRPYVNDEGKITPGTYKETIKSIHTDVVTNTIANLAPNRVLNARPPEVNLNQERLLPRQTRCVLRQLRSGHCVRLKDYQLRLGKVLDDRCPDCGVESHNVNHLFNCVSNPTTLTAKDLWEKPIDVVAFLTTLTAFNFLEPPPQPPSPRRRRRRRPPNAPTYPR